MSTFPQHRAMHDAGPFTAAIHTGHNHGSHAAHHHQAAVTGHFHAAPCPYEEKVTKDGTTARMVLLFLRELLEQLAVAEHAQQSYGCPMTKCHRTFAAPLQVIQHLLSCPELPGGEFDCDRCNTSHSFPTNEKDWSQWMGWRFPHSMHGNPIQRKRSLGSKMKDFALWKKDPSRKQNPVFDPHFRTTSATADTRPSTAASETPSTPFTNRAFPHHVVFPGHSAHGPGPGFPALQKSVLPSGLPEVDGSMFWPGFNAACSDLPSTVSSIAMSSTLDDSPSERLSQNTSQTTLFTNTGLGSYQQPPATSSGQDSTNNISASQQYIFPTQLPFNGALTSLPSHAPSTSAMCLDEPLRLPQSPLSPSELHSAAPGGGDQGWWGPKVEVETPRPTPPSSGPDSCFPLGAGMLGDTASRGVSSSGISSPTSPGAARSPLYRVQQTVTHTMSRALSQESMQSSITTLFGTPAPEGSVLGALSPHAEHHHSAAGHGRDPSDSSVEDLVCDECQWKPRGVRENLKGYLRKHKNTHKGVRLACDIPGCLKTFSRLDNLKKHKKDKHGIEDTGGAVPAKREFDCIEEEVEPKRPGTVESELRGGTEDYSMLWPALHF